MGRLSITAGMSDFFQSDQGRVDHHPFRGRALGRLRDAALDLGLALSGGSRELARLAAAVPPRRVLTVGVAAPSRPGQMEAVVSRLSDTRHEVAVSVVPMAPMSKFQNVTRALEAAPAPAHSYDWVFITDDDVGLPPGFTDRFVGLLERGGFQIAQPAHRFFSYSSYVATQRRWGSLARQTRFVEIGPLTAVRGDVIGALMPFPVSRWDWGLDVHWAQIARDRGWRIGVLDGTPIEHRQPVAGSYDWRAAVADGEAFLARNGVTMTRAECFAEDRIVIPW
jgi:hypothetical protein